MQIFLYQVGVIGSSILCSLLISPIATAQITPDSTLGNESSIVSPNVNIKGKIADLIEGGAIRDSNLFHSFLEFNIEEGQNVFFANPEGVINILTRVTGNKISEILGTLGVNGNANLFFINPNGIVFGENASLDVNGSFLASTAKSINFADGTQFNATDSQTQPLLTVSAPIGLGLGERPGSIVNRSLVTDDDENFIGLQVQPGKTLALVGGDINIEGGVLTAPGGRIELGSVAGNNTVSFSLDNQGNNITLNYKGIENFQDIILSGEALVEASGEGGGNIQIQAKNLTLQDGSLIFADTQDSKQGGNIFIHTQQLLLEDESFLTADVLEGASGQGGNITIETEKLIVRGGSQISTNTFDEGNAGNLTVKASNSVEVIGVGENYQSGLFASVQETTATGNSGTLSIETRQLILKDGGNILASTFGEGNAGDLIIKATESVEIEGTAPDNFNNNPTGIFAQVEQGATGNARNLSLETGRLTLLGGAQISTAARDGGNAGDLNINASDSILLSGTAPDATLTSGQSGIFVSAEPAYQDDSGNLIVTTADAGNLNITTGRLTVEKGAKISADNFGTGKGGNATLNVNQLVVRDGGLVRAGSLVEDGAISQERGAGGTLTINASEFVEVTGTGQVGNIPVKSTLFTQAEGTGDAGNLNIFTPKFTVRDGAEVTVSATGEGQAGSLIVDANSILLDRGGSLRAETKVGDRGNITLNARDIILRRGSDITTNAAQEATGGDIAMNTDILAALENSDITANAVRGKGGNIQITTQGIFLSLDSEITASSELGIDGTVNIITPEVDPTSGILELPSTPVDAESLIAKDVCRLEDGKIARGSSFVITGKGGLPPSAEDPLINSHRIIGWETTSEEPESSAVSLRERPQTDERTEEIYPVIQQAQGWKRSFDGTLLLTAQATTATPQSPEGTSPHCRSR